MTGEIPTDASLKIQFFELTERITTDLVGPDFAVSTMDEPTPEEVLENRMPRNPALEITTLYLGARGKHNIEIASFSDYDDGVEFEMNKYIDASEIENEWFRYIYERLCRFIGRQNVVAVYPSVIPLNITGSSKFAVSSEPAGEPFREVDNRGWERSTDGYFAA